MKTITLTAQYIIDSVSNAAAAYTERVTLENGREAIKINMEHPAALAALAAHNVAIRRKF